jgi:hypothetical protein
MNHQQTPDKQGSPATSAPCDSSSELHADLAQLPCTVQRMMRERGVTTPEALRSTAAFMRSIEQNLDASVLESISDPHADILQVLRAVQGSLTTRSAEALAIHLYTKELLRLMTVAAARQQLAVRKRREPNREKQILLTTRRYFSRRARS